MAKMIDVIMAQYDRNVSVEERETQKRLENDSTLRAINDIGAMATGATTGYQIGTGIDEARQMFKNRSAGKAGYMADYTTKNPGSTMKDAKKAWRKSGRKEFKEFMRSTSPLEIENMDRAKLVSTYLEGVNLAEVTTDGKNVVITDNKSKGKQNWLNVSSWFGDFQTNKFGTGENLLNFAKSFKTEESTN